MKEDDALMPDWNADVYHRISEPQFKWGLRVLDDLALQGDETVIDAGCGSGRLTTELLKRLPRGKVIAVDASAAMLTKARQQLSRWGARVRFIAADLTALEIAQEADVVFSNATFHWIADHATLFQRLFAALRPGGRLHAQCGGSGNLRAHLELASQLAQPALAPSPTFFATPPDTLARLTAAGFDSCQAWLTAEPTPFATAAAFREFVAHVTLRTVLPQLGEGASQFLDQLVAASGPPFALDYVRLDLRAQKPTLPFTP